MNTEKESAESAENELRMVGHLIDENLKLAQLLRNKGCDDVADKVEDYLEVLVQAATIVAATVRV